MLINPWNKNYISNFVSQNARTVFKQNKYKQLNKEYLNIKK